MPIKKSISGMRGTIGGIPGDNLTPIDIVEMTAAYGAWVLDQAKGKKVVVGMDGRISGPLVSELAINALIAMGLDVVDLGLSTTPTVAMAVTAEKAAGGIIFTASHNPREWNALKLLNHKGEFISASAGNTILRKADSRSMHFATIDDLGKYKQKRGYIDHHVRKILDLKIIKPKKIRKCLFKVVVDCINSTGALAIPPLLDALGCGYVLINDDVTGEFAHAAEPLPKNLKQLSKKVVECRADLGIAVDPDVDRLVLVSEDGSMFGEEYTLVAVADYILSKTAGATVSNLSSSRALADLTRRYKQKYTASAVGEVNVVKKMKKIGAVIGGEGNGGIIYPPLHYGRDALVGIAIVLNLLAERDLTLSELRKSYPEYHIVKSSVKVKSDKEVAKALKLVEKTYIKEKIDKQDGIKIDWPDAWVHVRGSNTEPILRVIAEAPTPRKAKSIVDKVIKLING